MGHNVNKIPMPLEMAWSEPAWTHSKRRPVPPDVLTILRLKPKWLRINDYIYIQLRISSIIIWTDTDTRGFYCHGYNEGPTVQSASLALLQPLPDVGMTPPNYHQLILGFHITQALTAIHGFGVNLPNKKV